MKRLSLVSVGGKIKKLNFFSSPFNIFPQKSVEAYIKHVLTFLELTEAFIGITSWS